MKAPRTAYTYTVLQYRHSPFAEERLNVGVALLCRSRRFFDVRIRRSWKRFSEAYPSFDRARTREDFNTLARAAKVTSEECWDAGLIPGQASWSAEDILSTSYGPPEGSIVWTKHGGGTTKDPLSTLDRLYEEFVGRFDQEDQVTRRDDDDVYRTLERCLQGTPVLTHLQDHIVRSPYGDVRFRRSFRNGIWHCVQPLSFDHKDAGTISQKAATWHGHIAQVACSVEQNRTYLLLGAPQDKSMYSAFRSAKGLLERAAAGQNAVVETEDRSDAIADELINAFRSH